MSKCVEGIQIDRIRGGINRRVQNVEAIEASGPGTMMRYMASDSRRRRDNRIPRLAGAPGLTPGMPGFTGILCGW